MSIVRQAALFVLAPTVLYANQHPANSRHHDPKMLKFAMRIGDLLAAEDEKGAFEPRPELQRRDLAQSSPRSTWNQ